MNRQGGGLNRDLESHFESEMDTHGKTIDNKDFDKTKI